MRELRVSLSKRLDFSLNDAPHVLVSGSTGSGKSYLMTGVIDDLMREYAGDVKFLMIDPKKVEFWKYRYSYGLLLPVMYDMQCVRGVLDWLVNEVECRYDWLRRCNAVAWSDLSDEDRKRYETEGGSKIVWSGYIVLCVDELSDLMMYDRSSDRNEVREYCRDMSWTDSDGVKRRGMKIVIKGRGKIEECLVKIAQKARAAGIHMILATQRPDAKVLSGLLRVNVPTRICLKVQSMMDSIIGLGVSLRDVKLEDVRKNGGYVDGRDRRDGSSENGCIRGCHELLGKGDGILNMGGKCTRFQYEK